MTPERKAELFDGAMGWVYKHLVYGDETEYEETLEEIGFTEEEIAEQLSYIFDDDKEEL